MDNEELYKLLSNQINALDNKFEKKFNQLDEKFEKKFNQLDEKFENISKQLNNQIKDINHTLVIIENDHGNMLSALFDNMEVNEDRNKENKNNFKLINKRLDNHSIRIANIEDSVKKLLNQNK